MDLNMELTIEDPATEKIQEFAKKLKDKGYQPTHEEIWITGYTGKSGKHKNGIFQMSNTDRDLEKLHQVKQAIETGEIGVEVDDMKKFSKSHAMTLYRTLVEKRKTGTIKKMIEEIPDNYFLINNYLSFSKLLADLNKETEFAIDTETSGLGHLDRICGISITLPLADYHVYIPVRHTEGKQLPAESVFEGLKPILEDPEKKQILYNSKFDAHMFIKEGIHLANIHFDGYVAFKLLSENEQSYALKNLSTKYGRYFGFEDKSETYETLFGRGGFQDTPFEYQNGPGIGVVYACKDTALTYAFFKHFVMAHFDRLPKIRDLYFNIEQPITHICIDMEQAGMKIDLEFAAKYGEKLKSQIQDLEIELVQHFGSINVNSPVQLAKVLYDEFNLPDISKKRSTDAKTLKKLASQHGGVDTLLKYRELNKLLTTYIDPLPQMIWPEDGRLHGNFLQVQAQTGRFASSGPNLQNLPVEARKMVIPEPGKIIVGVDYSQIEPRVLSHISGDEKLREAYRNDLDLYQIMAADVYKVPIEHCHNDAPFKYRKNVKSILLGIMYGMGPRTLSQSIKSTEQEAIDLIAAFFEAYPKVKAWIDSIHIFAEENEYVETLYGRKRRFPGHKRIAAQYHAVCQKIREKIGEVPDNIWQADLPYMLKRDYWDVAGKYNSVCRMAVNTIIQGSAADLMKLALIATSKICKEKGWPILATIHDEILFELPRSVTKEEIESLENAMKSITTLAVPLKVDTAFMERWGVEIKKDEWYKGVAS